MAVSLLALLDDITSVLDDVSLLTKVAAKKTAGVLGDDLALNAQQVTGVDASREIPVVWAVAKGSLVNKAILVPLALVISAFAPWLVTPLLMIGGAFLCYEGFEKIVHRLLHPKDEVQAEAAAVQAAAREGADLVAFEKDKIKGAIRTDFILSAEIIVIALGTVTGQPLATRVLVLVGIALAMTVGVYGLVAGIVKLDDLGLWLLRRTSAAAQAIGRGVLALAPRLMQFLSIAGTAAMFLVGGSIIGHGLPFVHHLTEPLLHAVPEGVARALASMVADAVVGLVVGAIAVAVVTLGARMLGRGPARASH